MLEGLRLPARNWDTYTANRGRQEGSVQLWHLRFGSQRQLHQMGWIQDRGHTFRHPTKWAVGFASSDKWGPLYWRSAGTCEPRRWTAPVLHHCQKDLPLFKIHERCQRRGLASHRHLSRYWGNFSYSCRRRSKRSQLSFHLRIKQTSRMDSKPPNTI